MKLLRPLRERAFALLWTGMTVLGDEVYAGAGAPSTDSGSGTPAIS